MWELRIRWQAIVRCNELQFPTDHPHIGESIVIVVRFSSKLAAFVIGRYHDRYVFVHVNLHVRQLRDIHSYGPAL